jgi:hypothetical protein
VEKNFTIWAFVEVSPAGAGPIDLHSCYVTHGIATDPAGETATLTFRREHEWPGPANYPEEVTLTCSGNLRFAFNDLAATHEPLAGQSVTIGYYDAFCDWNDWLDEDQAAAQGYEGLQIGFSGGLVLRIRADTAELRTA